MTDVSQETNGTQPVHRSGICKCGSAARPGQGDCYPCHAAAQLRYTARQADKRKSEHAAYLRLIAETAKSEGMG